MPSPSRVENAFISLPWLSKYRLPSVSTPSTSSTSMLIRAAFSSKQEVIFRKCRLRPFTPRPLLTGPGNSVHPPGGPVLSITSSALDGVMSASCAWLPWPARPAQCVWPPTVMAFDRGRVRVEAGVQRTAKITVGIDSRDLACRSQVPRSFPGVLRSFRRWPG